MIGPGRQISEAEMVSLRAALILAYRQAGIMRRNVDQLAELVRDPHLLSNKDFEEAWRYGANRAKDSKLVAPAGDADGGLLQGRCGASCPAAGLLRRS